MPSPSDPPGPRPPSGASQRIWDLAFTETHRHRPAHLVAPRFVADEHEHLGRTEEVIRSSRSPEAPFAAVHVEMPGGATRGAEVVAGLVSSGGDHLLATYHPGRHRAALEVRTGGRTITLARSRLRLAPGATLGFALCENQATLLVRDPGGPGGPGRRASSWRPVLTQRDGLAALLDLRVPATLARFGYAWGVRGGGATLGAVRAGLFGMTGVRDLHVVQDADGQPLRQDGALLLTATCAGLGFFPQAHWGVFTLDLDAPHRFEQVAQLFAHRDGLVLGDHAGQLVRDGDHWLVATSAWGDFVPVRRRRRGRRAPDAAGHAAGTVHVRHLTTTADLLTGVHLLATERTDLPTVVGSWDPGLTRVDGRWYLGFVESPTQAPYEFHPALASTDAASPWEGLVAVGAAEELRRCEGPVLVRVGADTWLLASDGHARRYPVFDLAMVRRGELAAAYPSNIPHPQLVARGDGSWAMVTFDGTASSSRLLGYGGHGNLVVLSSPAP